MAFTVAVEAIVRAQGVESKFEVLRLERKLPGRSNTPTKGEALRRRDQPLCQRRAIFVLGRVGERSSWTSSPYALATLRVTQTQCSGLRLPRRHLHHCKTKSWILTKIFRRPGRRTEESKRTQNHRWTQMDSDLKTTGTKPQRRSGGRRGAFYLCPSVSICG